LYTFSKIQNKVDLEYKEFMEAIIISRRKVKRFGAVILNSDLSKFVLV